MNSPDVAGATKAAPTLYFHPLSSFCQKVLIAFYENETAFVPEVLQLNQAEAQAALDALWPVGRFPLARTAEGELIPESSIIVEYLDQHFPGRTRFVPADPDAARTVRLWDRIFDLYVNVPMQKIVTDRLRPAGEGDGFGVTQARELLAATLGVVEGQLARGPWAAGDTFTLADCAAAPALAYADMVAPFAETHPRTAAYLARLKARPSFARVLEEAKPFLALIPQ